MGLKNTLFCLVCVLCFIQCFSDDAKIGPGENEIDTANKNNNANVDKQPVEAGSEKQTSTQTPTTNNATAKNMTTTEAPNWYMKVVQNQGMLKRATFVLLACTSIVVLYFGIKAWRTRRRRSKSRKYGLITSSGADLEMEPLDRDDGDDDDMTVFERTK